ncbi:MAG TPA: hypothetical protein VFP98_10975 [Candidatus Polarisedimenticolia bacterium]|nr:hypothetical protein [Candidatus Polarisedimenticolia bacterium]
MSPMSLGDFAVRVATGIGLPAPNGGHTPESAAWGLLGRGIRLRADLAAPLTEADAVGALVGLGYRIRTTTPSRVMSRDRAEAILRTFLETP